MRKPGNPWLFHEHHMRTIIAGSRTFTDKQLMWAELAKLKWLVTSIISGCASGADSLTIEYGQEFSIPIERFPADWSKGRGAGFIRNNQMALAGEALVVFWNGKSSGTRHMLEAARKAGIKLVRIVKY